MKKTKLISLLLCPLILCTAGCEQEDMELTGVVFERGHGSMWGNQFFVEVSETEVIQIQYFSADDPGGELKMNEHIPLEPEQWEEIKTSALAMLPQLQKETARKKKNMADGGEYYKLTFLWEKNGNIKEIQYKWPYSEEADAFASLLFNLTPQ